MRRIPGVPAPILSAALEVTESDDFGSGPAARQALRALGVWPSVDDLGTGSSSLGRLREFSFDNLTIDRSFLPDWSPSASAASVITAMAAGLHMSTMAQRVEAAPQARMLADDGCNDIQRCFSGRPVSARYIQVAMDQLAPHIGLLRLRHQAHDRRAADCLRNGPVVTWRVRAAPVCVRRWRAIWRPSWYSGATTSPASARSSSSVAARHLPRPRDAVGQPDV